MLSELSVFLRGSCSFEANGRFPERFLNLCARSDMGLWDIKRSETGISARIVAGRYARLLPYARRCGVHLHVTGRFGLPFRLSSYRRRPGMPLGFMAFCGILWLLSLFIWSVELPALSEETGNKLKTALDEMNVSAGTLRSHIDAQRMGIELQLRVPELTWAGISTFGSSLTVNAKEYEPVSSVPPEGEPCNIVAASDGVILGIEPLRGSVEVQPGQTVLKGDLLVSGVIEHLDGTVQITDASAVVWASTNRTISCTMPFRQLVYERTGRLVTRHRIMLFGLEIPLLFSVKDNASYEREYDYWQMKIGEMNLPFEVYTERCYEITETPVTYSPDQAKLLALSELEQRLVKLGYSDILDKKTTVESGDNGVTVEMTITVKENIAAPSAIGIH